MSAPWPAPARARVAAAQDPLCDFPLQNLPFGVFSDADPVRRVGVAIGDHIADLAVLHEAGLLPIPKAGAVPGVFVRPALNDFIALGQPAWRAVRAGLGTLLAEDGPALPGRALVPQAAARLHLPVSIGGYTDFYSSREHAEASGRIFRGAASLPANWLELPIAYNGRASSVVVSGTAVRRPWGQSRPGGQGRPGFGPSAALDFELETGLIIGCENALGSPVPIARAEDHMFGLVLLNDWSARDLQAWEYIPLGPFNGKSFATSVSPWVVTLDALAPFRCASPPQDPSPLAYLQRPGLAGSYDIVLQASLRPRGGDAVTISRSNHRHLYWTMTQQLAHHTVSGCNLRVGDLCGSGTISAPGAGGGGSLLELTSNGSVRLDLGGGITRGFLEDGDTVTLTGWAQGDGYRVGFGSCRGLVEPALVGEAAGC